MSGMKVAFLVLLVAGVQVVAREYSSEYPNTVHSLVDNVDLPQLNVSGTHYGVGFAVGSAFAARIQNFVNAYSGLNDVLLPFYSSSTGKSPSFPICSLNIRFSGAAIVSLFIESNSAKYPQYWDEIEGIADGSGTVILEGLQR